MKIRTDFVTNSSSSSYVCDKVATFALIDRADKRTEITFKRSLFKAFGDDGEFSQGFIEVPELFNEFMIIHYRDTKKIAGASAFLNSLLGNKNTPIIKEFIKNTGIMDISGPISYFSVENSSAYDDWRWEDFLKHLNRDYYGVGVHAEFIKAYENELKYNFMVLHFGKQEVFAVNRFNIKNGYDEDAEFVFGEIKQKFAELNAVDTFSYFSEISSKCNLPEEVMKAIENGEIKILFFARDTGVCDEIIWYSGELKQENIKIHLISEGEKVTDIGDNTEEVNNIIKRALNSPNKTVEPIGRREISKKAKKEMQETVAKTIIADAFNETSSEEMKKSGKKTLATVLFADDKKFKYYCEFPVQEGDKVYVEGKRAGEVGVITEISNQLPKGTAASYTLNVVRAFSKE